MVVASRAVDIAARVRSGELRASDVVEAHLDHLRCVEPHLGAFTHVRDAHARTEAAAIDAHPARDTLPLAGVPLAVKDVVDVAGDVTRHGSRALADRPAAHDHPIVARLRAAGAIIVGRTRCPEFSLWATSDDPDGIARSPWDPTVTAGGSSGGSAAAVAAGVVPLALGSDGGGSIRIPAATTGCVGIRPGAPLLGLELDGRPHWSGLTRLGPLATCVEDLRLALDVMADVAQPRSSTPSTLRIGVCTDPALPGLRTGRAARAAADRASGALRERGHEVVPVTIPYRFGLVLAFAQVWLRAADEDMVCLRADPRLLQRRTRLHARLGKALRWVPRMDEPARRRWQRRVEPLLAEYDVILTPLLTRPLPRAIGWHRRSWVANAAAAGRYAAYFTPSWNLADVPSASVPVPTGSDRLSAVQLVAAGGREAAVLDVAGELQAAAPWPRYAPGWLPDDPSSVASSGHPVTPPRSTP